MLNILKIIFYNYRKNLKNEKDDKFLHLLNVSKN